MFKEKNENKILLNKHKIYYIFRIFMYNLKQGFGKYRNPGSIMSSLSAKVNTATHTHIWISL